MTQKKTNTRPRFSPREQAVADRDYLDALAAEFAINGDVFANHADWMDEYIASAREIARNRSVFGKIRKRKSDRNKISDLIRQKEADAEESREWVRKSKDAQARADQYREIVKKYDDEANNTEIKENLGQGLKAFKKSSYRNKDPRLIKMRLMLSGPKFIKWIAERNPGDKTPGDQVFGKLMKVLGIPLEGELQRRIAKKLIASGEYKKAKEVPFSMAAYSDDEIRSMYQKLMQQGIVESKLTEGVLDDVDDDGVLAKRQLYDLAKYSIQLHKMIQDSDNLEPWVQSKIAIAADYIDTIKHHLEYNNVRGDADLDNEVDDLDNISSLDF